MLVCHSWHSSWLFERYLTLWLHIIEYFSQPPTYNLFLKERNCTFLEKGIFHWMYCHVGVPLMAALDDFLEDIQHYGWRLLNTMNLGCYAPLFPAPASPQQMVGCMPAYHVLAHASVLCTDSARFGTIHKKVTHLHT